MKIENFSLSWAPVSKWKNKSPLCVAVNTLGISPTSGNVLGVGMCSSEAFFNLLTIFRVLSATGSSSALSTGKSFCSSRLKLSGLS